MAINDGKRAAGGPRGERLVSQESEEGVALDFEGWTGFQTVGDRGR